VPYNQWEFNFLMDQDPMGTSAAAPGPSPDSLELTRRAWDLLIAGRDKPGLTALTVTSLADFLKAAEDLALNPVLTIEDRCVILDQAELLIRDLYPHLYFKQRDFKDAEPPVDPLERIGELRARIRSEAQGLSDLAFHLEMLKIFATVRDPHTAYALPEYFHGAVAFLPFRAGFYADALGRRRYIVTAVMEGFDHPDFTPGAELVSARGADFTKEVDRAALLSPGANAAAQHLRGLMRLTVRPLATAGTGGWHALSDAEFASFDYLPADYLPAGSSQRHSISFPWGVARGAGLHQPMPDQAFSMSRDLSASHHAANLLYNRLPQAPPQSRFPDVFEFQCTSGTSGSNCVDPGSLAAPNHPDKRFGYIAVKSFNSAGSANVSEDLPNEFARILKLLQPNAPDGLLVDIRSNPGGDIAAAESMLQMLTPQLITPANFHLANTDATQKILKIVANDASSSPELRAWAGQAARIPLPHGSPLTQGEPLTSAANAVGQVYQGPVVLLVDALTYSAADIFAGGFSDNRVGKVISPDPATGGGGASVWSHSDIVARLPAGVLKLETLPNGAAMSLAIMRSSRVGPNLGKPIEDIGVHPDVVHPRTLRDLLAPAHGSLIRRACELLADMPAHRIEILDSEQMPAAMAVKLTVVNLDRLEFTLDQDDAPSLKINAAELTSPVMVPFHSGGFVPGEMVVRGFSGDELAASARIVFEAPTANRRRRSD
jgi:hypothetical protein